MARRTPAIKWTVGANRSDAHVWMDFDAGNPPPPLWGDPSSPGMRRDRGRFILPPQPVCDLPIGLIRVPCVAIQSPTSSLPPQSSFRHSSPRSTQLRRSGCPPLNCVLAGFPCRSSLPTVEQSGPKVSILIPYQYACSLLRSPCEHCPALLFNTALRTPYFDRTKSSPLSLVQIRASPLSSWQDIPLHPFNHLLYPPAGYRPTPSSHAVSVVTLLIGW